MHYIANPELNLINHKSLYAETKHELHFNLGLNFCYAKGSG